MPTMPATAVGKASARHQVKSTAVRYLQSIAFAHRTVAKGGGKVLLLLIVMLVE